MKKRALLLSAVVAALVSVPALAAGPTTISTKQTSAIDTTTDGDITIDANGSVVVKASGPAVTINSSNSVSNAGTISNKDTSNATGVKIDLSTASLTGNLTDTGTIDLGGTGNNKIGVLVYAGLASNTFTGNIDFGSGSTLSVTGNSAIGVKIEEGTTLNGDLTFDGKVALGPTKTGTTISSPTAALIQGDITGNIAVGGTIAAVGSNAQGIFMMGDLGGSFTNTGNIGVSGTTSPKSGSTNPASGTAVTLEGNVGGGFYNAGPDSVAASTQSASISSTGSSPTVLISTGAVASSSIVIGTYSDPDGLVLGASFINRGNITSKPINPNATSYGVQFLGTSSLVTTTLSGNFYNSGSITAQATTDDKGAGVVAAALWIGDYVNLPNIINSNDSPASGAGTISASVSGPSGGSAIAIRIDPNADITGGTLTNQGNIIASAASTLATGGAISAHAIFDASGTLLTIANSGTISATASGLTDTTKMTATAVDLQQATGNITFTNTAGSKVIGSVLLGNGNDTFSIVGAVGSGNASILTGSGALSADLSFAAGDDTLQIGDYATVVASVTHDNVGTLDITVGGSPAGSIQSALLLTNTSTNLLAHNIDIYTGADFGLTLTNNFDHSIAASHLPIVQVSNEFSFGTSSNMSVVLGQMVAVDGPAQFVLIDAPSAGAISIANPSTFQSQILTAMPFLYVPTMCGTESGFTACSGGPTITGDHQIQLNLTLKDANTVGLTGFANQIYNYANAALVTDTALGTAVVNAGLPTNCPASCVPLTQAQGQALYQGIYTQFAPDVTGASRQVAIQLTDQETGPVGARQRALRMYAGQPADVSMWGQEFVQRLDDTAAAAGGRYRDSGFGFALGVDGGSPSVGRYGGAFTFFSGDASEVKPRKSTTRSEWYMLSGYSNWRGKGLFFDSQFSVGYGSFRGHRVVTAGTVSRSADGNRNGLLLSGGFTTGAIFTFGGTSITPQVAIDGLTMREDGYSETGGGTAVNLQVSPYYSQSFRGYIGTSLRQDVKFSDLYFQPEVRVGYRYDMLADPAKIKASFLSIPSSTFSLTGPDPGKGNLVAGASVSTTTDTWSIGLNYDFLRANDGSVSQIGTLSLIGRI